MREPTKSTPGPWVVEHVTKYDPRAHVSDARVNWECAPFLRVVGGPEKDGWNRKQIVPGGGGMLSISEENEANARLIAAAPALRDALRACDIALGYALAKTDAGICAEARETARAALALAGEE